MLQKSSNGPSAAPAADDSHFAAPLLIGRRVIVNDHFGGRLHYIGPVGGKPGTFCGVELDAPCTGGKNDGIFNGIEYFKCRPGYGAFAPIHKVQLVEPSAGQNSGASRKKNDLPLPATPRSSIPTFSSVSSATKQSNAIRVMEPARKSPSATVIHRKPGTPNVNTTIATKQQNRSEPMAVVPPSSNQWHKNAPAQQKVPQSHVPQTALQNVMDWSLMSTGTTESSGGSMGASLLSLSTSPPFGGTMCIDGWSMDGSASTYVKSSNNARARSTNCINSSSSGNNNNSSIFAASSDGQSPFKTASGADLMTNSNATYTVFDSDCLMLSDIEIFDASFLRLDENDDELFLNNNNNSICINTNTNSHNNNGYLSSKGVHDLPLAPKTRQPRPDESVILDGPSLDITLYPPGIDEDGSCGELSPMLLGNSVFSNNGIDDENNFNWTGNLLLSMTENSDDNVELDDEEIAAETPMADDGDMNTPLVLQQPQNFMEATPVEHDGENAILKSITGRISSCDNRQQDSPTIGQHPKQNDAKKYPNIVPVDRENEQNTESNNNDAENVGSICMINNNNNHRQHQNTGLVPTRPNNLFNGLQARNHSPANRPTSLLLAKAETPNNNDNDNNHMTPATRHISPSARHISPSTRLPLPPTVNHSATARATKPPSRTQQMMEQIRASIEADKLRPKREPRSKFAAHSKLANVVPLNVVISPAKIETTQGEVNSVSDVTSEAQTTLENNLNSPQQCEAIEQENERDGAKSAAVEESERSEVKNEICREEAPPAETEPLQHKQQQQQQQQQEVEDGDEQNDHKNTTALGKNDAVTSAHPTQRMPMSTKMGQQQPSNTNAIKIPTAMQPTKNFASQHIHQQPSQPRPHQVGNRTVLSSRENSVTNFNMSLQPQQSQPSTCVPAAAAGNANKAALQHNKALKPPLQTARNLVSQNPQPTAPGGSATVVKLRNQRPETTTTATNKRPISVPVAKANLAMTNKSKHANSQQQHSKKATVSGATGAAATATEFVKMRREKYVWMERERAHASQAAIALGVVVQRLDTCLSESDQSRQTHMDRTHALQQEVGTLQKCCEVACQEISEVKRQLTEEQSERLRLNDDHAKEISKLEEEIAATDRRGKEALKALQIQADKRLAEAIQAAKRQQEEREALLIAETERLREELSTGSYAKKLQAELDSRCFELELRTTQLESKRAECQSLRLKVEAAVETERQNQQMAHKIDDLRADVERQLSVNKALTAEKEDYHRRLGEFEHALKLAGQRNETLEYRLQEYDELRSHRSDGQSPSSPHSPPLIGMHGGTDTDGFASSMHSSTTSSGTDGCGLVKYRRGYSPNRTMAASPYRERPLSTISMSQYTPQYGHQSQNVWCTPCSARTPTSRFNSASAADHSTKDDQLDMSRSSDTSCQVSSVSGFIKQLRNTPLKNTPTKFYTPGHVYEVSDSDFEAAVAAAVKTGKTPLTLESQSDEPFRMSVDFDRNATMDSSFASTSADDGTAQKTGKNPLTLALNEQNDEPFQMTVDFERNATMDSSTDVSAEDV